MTKEEMREPTLREWTSLVTTLDYINTIIGVLSFLALLILGIAIASNLNSHYVVPWWACLIEITFIVTFFFTLSFSREKQKKLAMFILRDTSLQRITFMHKLYKGLWNSIAFERILLNGIKTFIVIIDTLVLCVTLPIAFLFAFPDLAFGVGSWIWLLFALEKEKNVE